MGFLLILFAMRGRGTDSDRIGSALCPIQKQPMVTTRDEGKIA
jgi:hypothetical protein